MMKNFAIVFAFVLVLATLEADVDAATGRATEDDSAVRFIDSQEQVSARGRHHIFRNDTKPWPDSRPRAAPPNDYDKRTVEKERVLILSGQATAHQLGRKADVGAKDHKHPTANNRDQRHRKFINDRNPWPVPRAVRSKDYNKGTMEANRKKRVAEEKERAVILSDQASTHQLDRKAEVGAKDDKYSTANKGDDQRHLYYIKITKPWPASRSRTVHPKDYKKRTLDANGKRVTVEKERALILSGQASTHPLDRKADVGAKDDKYPTTNNGDRHRIFRNLSNPWTDSHPRSTVPTKVYNQRKP